MCMQHEFPTVCYEADCRSNLHQLSQRRCIYPLQSTHHNGHLGTSALPEAHILKAYANRSHMDGVHTACTLVAKAWLPGSSISSTGQRVHGK